LKSQVSVEYLMIMGFVTLITIPLVFLFYKYTAESSDEIITYQVNQIANKIVDAAESVYFLGKPSQTTIKVNIPNQIAEASLQNREVYFKVKVKNGYYDVLQVSSVNITGTLPNTQGIHHIILKAEEGYVQVSYT